jgi:hypothetical protein
LQEESHAEDEAVAVDDQEQGLEQEQVLESTEDYADVLWMSR